MDQLCEKTGLKFLRLVYDTIWSRWSHDEEPSLAFMLPMRAEGNQAETSRRGCEATREAVAVQLGVLEGMDFCFFLEKERKNHRQITLRNHGFPFDSHHKEVWAGKMAQPVQRLL